MIVIVVTVIIIVIIIVFIIMTISFSVTSTVVAIMGKCDQLQLRGVMVKFACFHTRTGASFTSRSSWFQCTTNTSIENLTNVTSETVCAASHESNVHVRKGSSNGFELPRVTDFQGHRHVRFIVGSRFSHPHRTCLLCQGPWSGQGRR